MVILIRLLRLQRFQKDAIYRQMQEYKREKTSLEIELNDIRKRSAHHDDHLRTIDTWFAQVITLAVQLALSLSNT